MGATRGAVACKCVRLRPAGRRYSTDGDGHERANRTCSNGCMRNIPRRLASTRSPCRCGNVELFILLSAATNLIQLAMKMQVDQRPVRGRANRCRGADSFAPSAGDSCRSSLCGSCPFSSGATTMKRRRLRCRYRAKRLPTLLSLSDVPNSNYLRLTEQTVMLTVEKRLRFQNQ